MPKITKIQVSKGISWVEIPEAELYIQCGCPADSVKHLMKRGLIVTKEFNGKVYETGPNAILLSDVMIQNGSFTNLAEFPILQMLYRQGLIIPNHPNNTGEKPILMGIKEQLNAQLKYIYRGNYGLVNEDELIEAGLDASQAKEIMQMKLKFAFGKIKDTKELINTINIKDEKIEIKNKVFIKRVKLNQYEIEYDGESVTVDMSLKENEEYQTPYPLTYYNVKREYFAVIHSGEGDGWDINRPCMSSILMYQGRIYLIDAGPNILASLNALGIGVNEIEGIFHTHSHDDHFAGLTTLMRSDHKIKYYATKLVRASVAKKLSALLSFEEDSIENYFNIMDLEFDNWSNIEGLEVKPILSPHPVETNIFIFRTLWEDGYRSYAHFADIISLEVLKNMIKQNEDDVGISEEFYQKTKEAYLTKTDLKKIDIGGGLIHGDANDFKNDKSQKLILAHISSELNNSQKEIGSGASFGLVDVMIPDYQDYARRSAYYFLQTYFPNIESYKLRTLINNQILMFNSETILLKEGEENKSVYLVLTGNVEMINSNNSVYNILSSGALIGEDMATLKKNIGYTFRAANSVQVLNIPVGLYLNFIKQNNLFSSIKKLQGVREFLQKTWLFGDSISHAVLNKIAQNMKIIAIPKDETITREENNSLYLIESGAVERFVSPDCKEVLSKGDFFGEETSVFDTPSIFRVKTLEPTVLYIISGKLLRDIPIVHWKLFETYEKRKSMLFGFKMNIKPVLKWKDEYCSYVNKIDAQHQKLFDMANILFYMIEKNTDSDSIQDAFYFFINYSKFHFIEEEELMKKNGCLEYESFKKSLDTFNKKILEFQNDLKNNKKISLDDMSSFVRKWITEHVFQKKECLQKNKK